MSLRRTLSRLESAAARDTSDLMVHLSRLLATVDACLWPARFTSVSNYHFVLDAQADYFENGLSFTLEGSSDATWKQSERLRSSLVDAGWAVHCEAGKIRLTLLGDCVGRLAVGLRDLNSEITAYLFDRIGELPAERGASWVSEASLFAIADDTDYSALHTLTEFLLPLLSTRAIESCSSTIARCFYRRLADTLPTIYAPQIEQVGDCLDAYSDTFCRQIQQRKNATYDGTEIFVPLSASR